MENVLLPLSIPYETQWFVWLPHLKPSLTWTLSPSFWCRVLDPDVSDSSSSNPGQSCEKKGERKKTLPLKLPCLFNHGPQMEVRMAKNNTVQSRGSEMTQTGRGDSGRPVPDQERSVWVNNPRLARSWQRQLFGKPRVLRRRYQQLIVTCWRHYCMTHNTNLAAVLRSLNVQTVWHFIQAALVSLVASFGPVT